MNALKTFAVVRCKSEPFDAGQRVEVKLVLEEPGAGELYWRLQPAEAEDVLVGDRYAVVLQKVEF